jgi:hypothetical protein
MRSSQLAFVVVLGVVALGGCYSYRVVPVERAPVGETVRARVSSTEAERLRDVLGRDDRVVEGELLAQPDSAILVAVRTSLVGASVQTHQRVTLPRQGLLELEVRRLDRWKTLVVAGVVVGAATAVAVSQFNSATPSENGGKAGSNNSLVLPLGMPLRRSP